MSSFGERLKTEREKKGYNQKEFAEAIGVTPTRLNYWEKNKREPDFHNIRKMIDVLGCDADYLLGTKFSVKDDVLRDENIKKSLIDEVGGYYIKSNDEITILSGYRKLNGPGKAKLAEQLADMLSLEKYVSANSDSETAQEITPEITFDTPFQPLTSDVEIEAEVEDYRRQLIEEKELAEKSKALHDVKEA